MQWKGINQNITPSRSSRLSSPRAGGNLSVPLKVPEAPLEAHFLGGGGWVQRFCEQVAEGVHEASLISILGIAYPWAAPGTIHCQNHHIIIVCLWKLKSLSCVCILMSQLKRRPTYEWETLRFHGRLKGSLPRYQKQALAPFLPCILGPDPRIPNFREILC